MTNSAWKNGPKNQTDEALSEALVELGIEFGHHAKAGQGHVAIQTKDEPLDLVTEVDITIEKLFRQWLGKFYPEHKIIGEEGVKDTLSPDDTIWYIDPIDGTSNFIDGNDQVTMHFGCIRQGIPVTSFVGIPIQNRYFHMDTIPTQKTTKQNLIIGTEYLNSREHEAVCFDHILKKTGATGLRVKSIGINLLKLLEGESHVFYKPGTKLWDVIAPLILIYKHRPDLEIELIYATDDRPLCHANAKSVSPFSNDAKLIAHLNTRHQTNCRAGLILVYPKTNPELKTLIFDTLYTQ